MRGVKFRLYNKNTNTTHYPEDSNNQVAIGLDGLPIGYIFNPDISDDIVPFHIEELEVQQYTGLQDQNGKDIYIGDIMAFEVETAEGLYRADHYEVIINDFMKIPVIDSERGQCKLYEYHDKGVVVGDIHDMLD